MIEQNFRSPFVIYRAIKNIVEKYLTFSYLQKKKEFLQLAEEVFNMDPADDGKKLYKMFKVKNP